MTNKEEIYIRRTNCSQTLKYLYSMDDVVGAIVLHYGEKFAVIITRPDTSNNESEDNIQTYSEDDTNMISVNVALEKLEEYHTKTWTPFVTACWDGIEDYCAGVLTNLFNNTMNAVATEVIIKKEKIEEGQVLKTEVMGELCDSDGVKIALARVKYILDADFDYSDKDNMQKVERIIELLQEVANYVRVILDKGNSVVASLQELENSHVDCHKMWGELVFFADSGDVVTHKYHTTPKSKTAIRTFNPVLSDTMDKIENTVPSIIADQQAYFDKWSLVDKIDKSEFASNQYLEKAYNCLTDLREKSKKQYLSGELEDIGYRTSDVVLYLSGALAENKSNETHDTLMELQQSMQLSVFDGLNPTNIITRASSSGWKDNPRVKYDSLLTSLQSSLDKYKKPEKVIFSEK